MISLEILPLAAESRLTMHVGNRFMHLASAGQALAIDVNMAWLKSLILVT